MDTLLVAVVAIASFLLGALLMYPFLKAHFETQYQARQGQDKERVTQETLRRSSAILKGQVGERFAPFVPGFGYQPADARFLGSPIDYVVFDGLTDGEIRKVAFVEVKTGRLPLTPFQRQVKEAIEGKRVVWRVVELEVG
jgi:predicted Holliday junction resolvase-like endonuclease